jgi:AcrR family transcriptional regulator
MTAAEPTRGRDGADQAEDPATPCEAPAEQGARRPRLGREELLDAADAVIRRVGGKASAALIAKEAGVTKPIIYRHFGDLQDLYKALAVRHHDRLAHYLVSIREKSRNLDRRSRYQHEVAGFFSAVEREPNIFRFLMQAAYDTDEHEGSPPWLTRQYAEQIGAHLARVSPDLDLGRARAMGYAAAGALTTAASWWLDDPTVPREVIVEALTDFLVSGMSPVRRPPAA